MTNSHDHQSSIGVFDSGVGGLTVLKILAEKFPNENFIYLGDNARVPYGTKSPETIRRYTLEAMEYFHAHHTKLIVIACNSASSQFLEKQYKGISVKNVIEPGALAAIKSVTSIDLSKEYKIGVIATRATVQSKIYEKVLKQLAQEKNIILSVFQVAAPLLVPLAEEGWVNDPITNLIAYRYVQKLTQECIDALILGCTHYPILRQSIQKAVGNSVQLIDSGNSLAEIMKQEFEAGSIKPRINNTPRIIQIQSTEISSQFRNMAALILEDSNFDTTLATI